MKRIAKAIIQIIAFLVFSPVFIIMATIVTLMWAFDPKNRSWLNQYDLLWLGVEADDYDDPSNPTKGTK